MKKKFVIKKLDRDSDLKYRIGKNSHLDLALFFSGKKNLNVSLEIKLTGAGASAQILGFVTGEKNVTVNLFTIQNHNAPKTKSNLLIKSLLKDRSKVIYDGKIVVSKKANLTDAYQRNENLLLSAEARAISKPKLEILANDVRCTHGSTTGGLDQESLWYLTSRGMEENSAKKLLAKGFFESAISRISDTMNQDKLRRVLWQIMSK